MHLDAREALREVAESLGHLLLGEVLEHRGELLVLHVHLDPHARRIPTPVGRREAAGPGVGAGAAR